MRVPLRFQIMLPLAAVAVVSLLAVGFINARLATSQTQAAIDHQLLGVVSVLASSNFPLTDSVLRQMKGLSGADFVLTDEDGKLVSASQADLAAELPEPSLLRGPEGVILGPQIKIAGRAYFHSALRLKRPLNVTESGVLHVLFPRQQYDAVWRSAFLPPLVVGIATVIAIAVVTHWIANRIALNLVALGASVRRLAGGDFKSIELPKRDDEVRDLVLAVNQTATRLSEYEQHVRQTEQMRTVAMLGAGLAHEMRNAATGCRLAVDLHAESCPASEADDTLAVARSQLQLMEHRLQSFMQLGREEKDHQLTRLDLVELVEEFLPLVRPAARHARVKIQWQPTHKEVPIMGQRETLGMVIVNLLLNAIEAAQKQDATHSESHVGIDLRQDTKGCVELEVSDSGAGLLPEVARDLFQPFVSTKPEGVGLGLAVARQALQAHHGQIDWYRDGDRTRFRLRFPAACDLHDTERNGSHA